MEPPPECPQETPALAEEAAKFLNFIGGCPHPAAGRARGSARRGKAGGHTHGTGSIGSGAACGGLDRENGEGLGPAGTEGKGRLRRGVPGQGEHPSGQGDRHSGQGRGSWSAACSPRRWTWWQLRPSAGARHGASGGCQRGGHPTSRRVSRCGAASWCRPGRAAGRTGCQPPAASKVRWGAAGVSPRTPRAGASPPRRPPGVRWWAECGSALPAYLTPELETLEQEEQECLEVTGVALACPLSRCLAPLSWDEPCSNALLGAAPQTMSLWCPLPSSDIVSALPAWSPSPTLGGSWGRKLPTVHLVWYPD